MTRSKTLFVHWLVFVLALTVAVSAQNRPEVRYFDPTRYERATVVDDEGFIQWAEHKPQKCPGCAAKGKSACSHCWRFIDAVKTCIDCGRKEDRLAACRTCAGKGETADPLEKAHCPGCRAAGFLICMVCGGSGYNRVEGSGDKLLKCPGCRGDGGYPCGFCEGERLAACIALKPTLRDADTKTINKAMKTVDKMIAELDAFVGNGHQARKEMKKLQKILGASKKLMPPLKNASKLTGNYMKKIFAGSNFVGHEDREGNALQFIKSNSMQYLKHQKRMMELCLKRAEANEKLAAERKGK